MRTPGGLFWKLLIALWLAMAATVTMTAQFLRWQSVIVHDATRPVFSLLPIAPLVIGCGWTWPPPRPSRRGRSSATCASRRRAPRWTSWRS